MSGVTSFKLTNRKAVPVLESHEAWALLALYILEIVILKFY